MLQLVGRDRARIFSCFVLGFALFLRIESLRDAWRTNIWDRTLGMFSLALLSCVLRMNPLDHVLYSVDYSFSTKGRGKEFIEQIRKSSLMDEKQLEMFAYRNTESLLKVEAKLG